MACVGGIAGDKLPVCYLLMAGGRKAHSGEHGGHQPRLCEPCIAFVALCSVKVLNIQAHFEKALTNTVNIYCMQELGKGAVVTREQALV